MTDHPDYRLRSATDSPGPKVTWPMVLGLIIVVATYLIDVLPGHGELLGLVLVVSEALTGYVAPPQPNKAVHADGNKRTSV